MGFELLSSNSRHCTEHCSSIEFKDPAKTRGWLTDDDIQRILIIQEDICEKFGEIAIRERCLTPEQIDALLKEQEDNYIFFGEALVSIGAISEEQLIEELKEFNKLKLQSGRS